LLEVSRFEVELTVGSNKPELQASATLLCAGKIIFMYSRIFKKVSLVPV